MRHSEFGCSLQMEFMCVGVECGILDWNIFNLIKECKPFTAYAQTSANRISRGSYSVLGFVSLATGMSENRQMSQISIFLPFPRSPSHTQIERDGRTQIFHIYNKVIWTRPSWERRAFLNPPAEEKSIVFCWPPLEPIANALSSVQFKQLYCPLAVIWKSHLMGDKCQQI